MWRFLRDSGENMARAEQQVLMRAKKKGKLEKYGIVDIAADLKKIEEGSEKAEKEKQEQRAVIEALAMNIDYTPADGDKKEVEVPKTEKVREKRKSTKNKIQQQDSEGESALEGAEDESKEDPNGRAEKDSERENKEQGNTRQAKEEEKNSVDIEALATGILSEADREQDLKEQEEPLETERVKEKGKISQPTETTIRQRGLEGKKKSKDQRKKDDLGGGRPDEAEREQQASPKSIGKELAVEGVAQKSKEKDSTKKSPNRPKTGRGDKVEGQDRERSKEKPRKRDKSKNKERQRDKESEQDVANDEESPHNDPDPASNSDSQS